MEALKQQLTSLRDSFQQLQTENIVRMTELTDLKRNIETQE
jgi:hypothetical protein